MRELRAAVVGAGKLGALHADKYAKLSGVKLGFVVDIDRERAAQMAARYGATAASDHRELAGRIDLATVATPSSTHFAVAADLLAAGVDVLLEKPMAATAEQARALAALVHKGGALLQVGYLERFNPAVRRLKTLLTGPRFIECHRLAPFTDRGTDVDVVLDLMSHDLDLILSLTDSEVASVEALGVAVLTDLVDVANARVRFADGMVANVNASRVAARRERKIRFFQHDAYISTDYEARSIQVYRKTVAPSGGVATISAERIELDAGDPLGDEVASFVACVRSRAVPMVSAADGLRVIELCELINDSITAALGGGNRQGPR
jgi:predicted dehydrogenase